MRLSEHDCRRCWKDAQDGSLARMFLCPTCGNKRCPKATDHRLECTGSNEPGQKGSAYCAAPAAGLSTLEEFE